MDPWKDDINVMVLVHVLHTKRCMYTANPPFYHALRVLNGVLTLALGSVHTHIIT